MKGLSIVTGLLIVSSFSISAQSNSDQSENYDYGNSSETISLCTKFKTSSFTSNEEADQALERILSVVGASKRFVVAPCDNINNALAITKDGVRYILYDPKFINSISNKSNYWANMSILAHEIGHHINGHTLGVTVSAYDSKIQELEADRFSGFVLQKLGASLEEATDAISAIASVGDDTYSTHPNRTRRIQAITEGYNSAKSNTDLDQEELEDWEEYIVRAEQKEEEEDYAGAIEDYTESLRLKETFEGYYGRAWAKGVLADYSGEYFDLIRAMELSQESWRVYYRLATNRYYAEDNFGVLSAAKQYWDLVSWTGDQYDLKIVLYSANAFNNLNINDRALNILNGYIDDNIIDSSDTYNAASYCYEFARSYKGVDSLDKAIIFYQRAADIDQEEALYPELIGDLYMLEKKDYANAEKFYNMALIIDENKPSVYAYRSICYARQGDLVSALLDINEAIKYSELRNSYGLPYYMSMRASIRYRMDDVSGAEEDWLETLELGDSDAEDSLVTYCDYIYEDFFSASDFLFAGIGYMDSSNYPMAQSSFEMALNKGYSNPDLVKGFLIETFLSRSDYEEASRYYREIENSDSLSQTWLSEANWQIQEGLGDLDGAVSTMESFISGNQLDPSDPNNPFNEDFFYDEPKYVFRCYSKLCSILVDEGEYQRGNEMASNMIRIANIADSEVFKEIGYYYRSLSKEGQNDLLGAIQDINEAIKVNEEEFLYYALRGMLQSELGAKSRACADFDKATQLANEQNCHECVIDINSMRGDLCPE